MNELRERLQNLADAGAEGIGLSRPAPIPRARQRSRRAPALAGAAVAALVAIVTGAVIVAGGDGGNDTNVETQEDPADAPTAVVAVTYSFTAASTTTPVDLTLRFLDANDEVFAEPPLGEPFETLEVEPGYTMVIGSLVQDVPVGDLRLEATLQSDSGPETCSQTFTVAAGDRLILHLQVGDPIEGGLRIEGPGCAPIQTADQWVDGRTSGPEGESYIGLTPSEADDRAGAEGLTTQVAATDGLNHLTADGYRCERIDLMVFDEVVVAADLARESRPDACGGVTGP